MVKVIPKPKQLKVDFSTVPSDKLDVVSALFKWVNQHCLIYGWLNKNLLSCSYVPYAVNGEDFTEAFRISKVVGEQQFETLVTAEDTFNEISKELDLKINMYLSSVFDKITEANNSSESKITIFDDYEDMFAKHYLTKHNIKFEFVESSPN